jgi:glycosyltransferase involved in cell wall biosynthesis
MVTGDLYPYTTGGTGVVVDNLSRKLIEKGHEVTVITFNFKNRSMNKDSSSPYKILKYDYQFSPLSNNISFLMALDLFKKRNEFDIIHAHSHLFSPTVFCGLIRFLGSSPLIITNHGLYSQTAPVLFSELWNNTVSKFIYKRSDKIICLSQSDKDSLNQIGINSNKIDIIPNGIDADKFHPINKQNNHIKNILFVGRLVYRKGIFNLIDAFDLLIKKLKDVHLTIIGEGPEKDKLIEKIKKYNISEKVNLKSRISEEELIKEHQFADVFVLPSFSEGLPLVILEAFSCGTPVICSNLPQLKELVNNCGLTVPWDDTKMLFKAMSDMLSDDKLRYRFGKIGREKILKGFSWDHITDKTYQLYNNTSKGK